MVTVRTKGLFFDAPRVRRAVDKARRSSLSRGGAFVRRTAKQSIRKRKGPAPSGSPPHSHWGQLKHLLFFGYDPRADSVVVGPERFGRGAVPPVLEFGGSEVITTQWGKGKRKRRRVQIKARPFMGPALEKERPNLPNMWRNSVRG